MQKTPECDPLSRSATIDSYHTAMKRYEHSRRFGRELVCEDGGKGMPYHVNNQSHPNPVVQTSKRTGKKFRRPAHLHQGMRLDHLLGKQATFHVAHCKRNTCLYALDFDDVGGADYDKSIAAACRILTDIWPGLVPFIEPGRSFPDKKGFYVWFRVRLNGFSNEDRRNIETSLQQALKVRLAELPPGIKFDGLKGTASYVYNNPNFDWSFAREYTATVREFDVRGGTDGSTDPSHAEWMRWDDAKAYLKEHRPGISVHELPKCYVDGPRIERYGFEKMFYGIELNQTVDRKVRFVPDLRLERTQRHFGILVTAPCYKALSGERDNNVAEFCKWADDRCSEMTWRDVKAMLPHEKGMEFAARLKGAKANTKVAPQTQFTTLPVASLSPLSVDDVEVPCSLPQPVSNANWKQLLNENADPHPRYGAAARIALRYTEGDDVRALEVGLKLVELKVGPATGERHRERVDHMRRCVAFAAQGFDHDAVRSHSSTQKPFFDSELVASMESYLRQRVSKDLLTTLRQTKAKAMGRFKWSTCAVLALLFLHNIHTGNPGEVPASSLANGLILFNHSAPNNVITIYKGLLHQAHVITKVANHSTSQRQCARYELHSAASLPADVMDYLSKLETVDASDDTANHHAVAPSSHLEYLLPCDDQPAWSTNLDLSRVGAVLLDDVA